MREEDATSSARRVVEIEDSVFNSTWKIPIRKSSFSGKRTQEIQQKELSQGNPFPELP